MSSDNCFQINWRKTYCYFLWI